MFCTLQNTAKYFKKQIESMLFFEQYGHLFVDVVAVLLSGSGPMCCCVV